MTPAKDPKQRILRASQLVGDQAGDRATDWSENLNCFTIFIYFYSVPARERPFYYVFLIVRFTKYCKNEGKMAGAPPRRM